ncbi:DUF4124 domain-containing protein [Methyloterricola oryzae]|uniref:DUF4124 domain-containing protein n=1 Tax=Methyloterricola oryzae TaxID=1495050 RepID=UPI0009E5A766|nr:DUF4124 domain-containing protein [Methyloterricola oryzae]
MNLAHAFALSSLPWLLSSVQAGEVYRCTDANGRLAYTSDPSTYSGCVPARIDVTQPSEEEAARVQEERERALAEEREAEWLRLEEREIRAKEVAAEAALRQARAAEEAARQQESTSQQPAVPLGYYPYWGYGRGGFVPTHRPLPRPHDRPNPPMANQPGAGPSDADIQRRMGSGR